MTDFSPTYIITSAVKPSIGDLGVEANGGPAGAGGGLCGQLLGNIKMEDSGMGPAPDFGQCKIFECICSVSSDYPESKQKWKSFDHFKETATNL